jgi:hypothetical protein
MVVAVGALIYGAEAVFLLALSLKYREVLPFGVVFAALCLLCAAYVALA